MTGFAGSTGWCAHHPVDPANPVTCSSHDVRQSWQHVRQIGYDVLLALDELQLSRHVDDKRDMSAALFFDGCLPAFGGIVASGDNDGVFLFVQVRFVEYIHKNCDKGELHFDRPIVALILQKDLLDSSDAELALPTTDVRNIFRRGINNTDVVALSPDRRVLRVDFNVKNGVDQIRVLVAADSNLNSQ